MTKTEKIRMDDFTAYADYVLEFHSEKFVAKYYDAICECDKYDDWLIKLWMRKVDRSVASKILERSIKIYRKRFGEVQLTM